jgi:hypothetical protein
MKRMSYDDSREPISDSLEEIQRGTKKELDVIGDIEIHYNEWMDLLCKDCDESLMIVQLNQGHNKIKIVCSKCDGQVDVNIEKLIVEERED